MHTNSPSATTVKKEYKALICHVYYVEVNYESFYYKVFKMFKMFKSKGQHPFLSKSFIPTEELKSPK